MLGDTTRDEYVERALSDGIVLEGAGLYPAFMGDKKTTLHSILMPLSDGTFLLHDFVKKEKRVITAAERTQMETEGKKNADINIKDFADAVFIPFVHAVEGHAVIGGAYYPSRHGMELWLYLADGRALQISSEHAVTFRLRSGEEAAVRERTFQTASTRDE